MFVRPSDAFRFTSTITTAKAAAPIMKRMIGHLAERAISPAIFKRFKLSEVRQAHELLDSGTALGKIIMTRDD